jgi:hypothetical protein
MPSGFRRTDVGRCECKQRTTQQLADINQQGADQQRAELNVLLDPDVAHY